MSVWMRAMAPACASTSVPGDYISYRTVCNLKASIGRLRCYTAKHLRGLRIVTKMLRMGACSPATHQPSGSARTIQPSAACKKLQRLQGAWSTGVVQLQILSPKLTSTYASQRRWYLGLICAFVGLFLCRCPIWCIPLDILHAACFISR